MNGAENLVSSFEKQFKKRKNRNYICKSIDFTSKSNISHLQGSKEFIIQDTKSLDQNY